MIDLNARWGDLDADGPFPSRLLSAEFIGMDPLLAAGEIGDACVDRAMRDVGAGNQVFMEHLPFERIPAAAGGTHSPVAAALSTGLGSVVGSGPSVCAALYEAHAAAGTGAHPTGLVVLAAAHRDPPDTQRFRDWVREHVRVTEEAAQASLWESSPGVIADVSDVEAAGSHDAALASRVLQTISEEAVA